MALALQLIVFPAVLLLFIIGASMADSFNPWTLALGALLMFFVYKVGRALVRFAHRVDVEEGVEDTHIHPTSP
jgi:hypothetical protein